MTSGSLAGTGSELQGDWGRVQALPFTAKADLVGVHRGVARTEFALRKSNDLKELGDFFTAQLFEIQTGCGASQIGLELCSEKTPGMSFPAFFVVRHPRFTG